MPFKYHPPTRSVCNICTQNGQEYAPLITTSKGKASSADNFPIHNWFNFVLGYTPEFPEYLLNHLKIDSSKIVLDPFLGSGTTSVVCKSKGIRSVGIEANDFFKLAAEIKLEWDMDIDLLTKSVQKMNVIYQQSMKDYGELIDPKKLRIVIEDFGRDYINERYISDLPFAKVILINRAINKLSVKNKKIIDILKFALHSIIVPVSNIRYGPGFGIGKIKQDVDVFSIYSRKINRIIEDLINAQNDKLAFDTPSKVILGDARKMSKLVQVGTIDHMITSPPYPGDHEYTKHSRLELMFSNLAQSKEEFREIKKRMVRGSTTNIYKEDSEGSAIKNVESIIKITNEIDTRLKMDNATSGFEKLYTKLVWEYFGGMYKVFTESLKVLKDNGTFSLLVSDSHAFKMVHINTASILEELALMAGFRKSEIQLWQYKTSTSHKFALFENILILTK